MRLGVVNITHAACSMWFKNHQETPIGFSRDFRPHTIFYNAKTYHFASTPYPGISRWPAATPNPRTASSRTCAITSTRPVGWFHAQRPLGPFMTTGMVNNDTTGRDLQSEANGIVKLSRWTSCIYLPIYRTTDMSDIYVCMSKCN